MNDIYSIPDIELLKMVVKTARNKGTVGQPRWVHGMHALQLGSTYSSQLCRRFGLDPDEIVSR